MVKSTTDKLYEACSQSIEKCVEAICLHRHHNKAGEPVGRLQNNDTAKYADEMRKGEAYFQKILKDHWGSGSMAILQYGTRIVAMNLARKLIDDLNLCPPPIAPRSTPEESPDIKPIPRLNMPKFEVVSDYYWLEVGAIGVTAVVLSIAFIGSMATPIPEDGLAFKAASGAWATLFVMVD